MTPAPPHPRLLGTVSVKLRLVLGCGVLLLVGAMIAPDPAPTAILSVPEERAAPLIEEQVQARISAQVFRGLQDLAGRVAERSVLIPRAGGLVLTSVRDYAPQVDQPELPGAGVFVTAEGGVLTHETALGGRSALEILTADGLAMTAEVAALERSTGMVLLVQRSPVAAVQVPPLALSSEPGALVVGATRWEGRTIALPAFVTSVGDGSRYLLSATAGSIPPGTPVYDVDGRLVAVATGEVGATTVAIPAAAAFARLTELAESGRGAPSAIGADLQALVGSLATVYGDAGVLVADVVPDGPAAAAGLRPGDVLLDVDGTPVNSPESALSAVGAMSQGSEIKLSVASRGTRPRTVTVVVASLFDVNALARAGMPVDTDGQPEARALFSLARLRVAGVPPTARVGQINGRAITSRAQALADIRRFRPPLVVQLAYEGRRFFVAIDREP